MTTTQERKQVERQARRRRIQEAARGVFAEKGYAKTSIEQVARAANLSVGAIYLYFKSKEDLYISLLEQTLDQVEAELRKIRTTGRLADAWSYLAQWAATDIEATRVLRLVCQPGVRKQLSDEVTQGTGKRVTAVRDVLAGIIADGTNTGTYQSSDATAAADQLWALFIGLLMTADARLNLSLPGPSLAEAAHQAFATYETTLKSVSPALQAA